MHGEIVTIRSASRKISGIMANKVFPRWQRIPYASVVWPTFCRVGRS